jgi:hypothetical protein
MSMRVLLIIGLSITALATAYSQTESMGSDSNGAWRTSMRTNTIYHGMSPEIIVTVVTNRITQEEFRRAQEVAQEEAQIAKEEAHWREKIALVQVGMRRKEVEKILPPSTQPEIEDPNGNWYSLSYGLDDVWRVKMCYDTTGFHRGGSLTNAENKIIIPPQLLRPEMKKPIGKAAQH